MKRVLIGDPVIVKDWQLERTSRPGRALPFKPFTVTEIQAIQFANGHRSLSDLSQITTPKGTLPIGAYVAQLNVWEQWLNVRGVSLRDPGRRGSDGVTRLPLRFRLKNYATPNPVKVSTNGQATIDPRLIIDPGYPALTVIDPVAEFRVRPNEALTAWAAQHAAASATAHTSMAPPPPAPPSPKAPQCATPCALHYGDGGLVLSPLGRHIVDDDSWDEVCTIGLDNGGQPVQGGCLSDSEAANFPGKFKKTTTTPHSYRADAIATYGKDVIDALLSHYQDPCFMKTLGESYIPTFYTGAPGTSPGSKSVLTGVKAATFWDGILRLSWENANDCLGNTSGNGWFSGYLCLDYGAHAFYDKAEGFDVRDSAGIDAQVTLFGATFPIATGAQAISWRQKPTDTPKDQPDVSNTLQTYGDDLHYATPPFIIPIGPVALSVSGKLDVIYKLGSLDPASTHLAAFANKTVGQMSMKTPIGAQVSLDLAMDASIDVVIASAGIEGKLNAFTGSLSGSMASSIDAVKNDAILEKSYGFDGSAFSGSISAYVEVWYVVGSKRWSVDIVDFPGVTGDGKVKADDLEGSAVIPASAKSGCP